MKRKLLFAAFTLIMGLSNAIAADLPTSGSGEFFIKNVGTGTYLKGDAYYGTKAVVWNDPYAVTLTFVSDGVYTIKSQQNNGGQNQYFGSGGDLYVDQGSNNMTFTEVDAVNHYYTITNATGNLYAVSQTEDGVEIFKVMAGDVSTDYAKWQIVSRDELLAALDDASKSNPVDATFFIKDAGIDVKSVNAGSWSLTNVALGGGGNAGHSAESWNSASFNISQNVTGLPNGKYSASCYGYYRWNNGSDNNNKAAVAGHASGDEVLNAIFFAGTQETPLMSIAGDDGATAFCSSMSWADNTPNSQWQAAACFTKGYYLNTINNIYVSNGTLTLGVKKTTQAGTDWAVFDEFKLYYYGPTIEAKAVALPVGDMTVGKWYYFDIAVDGDYNLTAANLGNIVYTTDGTILIEDESDVTATFASAKVNLTTGRYYVKSSSAQTFTVVADVKTYEVGDVTAQSIAEGSYVNSLTTLVLTYGDAATNDDDAHLSVIGSPVATLYKGELSTGKTGTLTANESAKTLTATFTDVDLAANANDYKIIIPAGAFGYDGHAYNAEFIANFKTPILADDDYYIKNKETGAYLAAGANWGTQAITDNHGGHRIGFAALSNGNYNLDTYTYRDQNKSSALHYLNGDYFDGGAQDWTVEDAGDGYFTLSNGSGKLTGNAVGSAITITNGTGENTKWRIYTAAERKADFEAAMELATPASEVDATFYITAADIKWADMDDRAAWNGSPKIGGWDNGGSGRFMNAEKFNSTPFDVYQELTDLKPGVYKVTMQGFYRNGTSDDQNALLYANGFSKPVANIRSTKIGAQDNDKGFTTANGDYWVPNSQADAAKAFNNNYYNNELNFTVAPDGVLRIGVKKTTGASNDWAVFDNFQLTYYGKLDYSDLQTAYDAVVVPTLGFEDGEYAPYANAENLQAIATAKDYLDNETALTQAAIDELTAQLSSIVWTANVGDVECVYNGNFAIGQGSPAADIQQYGWTRTNNWGQFKNDAAGSVATAYYNQGGNMQYGNAGVYTMPLKANTIYNLKFEYGQWDNAVIPTVSVLNGEDGMKAMSFASPSANYKTAMESVDMVFATGAAGNYVLTINGSYNLVITGVSIKKAASQVLAFDENAALPAYAPGTYPTVSLARTIKAGINTVVLPFNMTQSEVESKFGTGSEVYAIDTYDDASENVTFDEQDGINANEPVLLKATVASSAAYTFEDLTVAAAATTPESAETNGLKMVGNYNPTAYIPESDGDVTNYVVSGGSLYQVDVDNVAIKSTRAYFSLTAPSPAKSLNITLDGMASDVTAPEVVETEEPEILFNMAGIQVDKNFKGVVINQKGEKRLQNK